MLDYMQGKKLLDKYGIKSVESKYVHSYQEAVGFAGRDSIAIKAISGRAIHKSKAGLVVLDVKGADEIQVAYRKLAERAVKFAPYKLLAQKMSKNGVEVIIGGNTDKQFGKMLLVGLGGIYVETLKDTALRMCPIEKYDAQEMLAQLKTNSIVTHNGAATDMLVDLLLRINKMFVSSSIQEFDFNPVIVRENDYEIVDIRILK